MKPFYAQLQQGISTRREGIEIIQHITNLDTVDQQADYYLISIEFKMQAQDSKIYKLYILDRYSVLRYRYYVFNTTHTYWGGRKEIQAQFPPKMFLKLTPKQCRQRASSLADFFTYLFKKYLLGTTERERGEIMDKYFTHVKGSEEYIAKNPRVQTDPDEKYRGGPRDTSFEPRLSQELHGH